MPLRKCRVLLWIALLQAFKQCDVVEKPLIAKAAQ
jgi:hypothetical protein